MSSPSVNSSSLLPLFLSLSLSLSLALRVYAAHTRTTTSACKSASCLCWLPQRRGSNNSLSLSVSPACRCPLGRTFFSVSSLASVSPSSACALPTLLHSTIPLSLSLHANGLRARSRVLHNNNCVVGLFGGPRAAPRGGGKLSFVQFAPTMRSATCERIMTEARATPN